MFRGSRNSADSREQGVGVEQWDRTEHHITEQQDVFS